MKNILFKIIEKFLRFHQHRKYKQYRTLYNLADDFRFNGKEIQMYGKGKILTGPKSYVGSYSTLQSAEGDIISIGSNCSISHNVRMYTQSAKPDHDFNSKPLPQKNGDIIIGNAVWIGANVFINPGVHIGDNAVIGANSVVTKNIEENAIYGGVPAKLIRYKRTSKAE